MEDFYWTLSFINLTFLVQEENIYFLNNLINLTHDCLYVQAMPHGNVLVQHAVGIILAVATHRTIFCRLYWPLFNVSLLGLYDTYPNSEIKYS